MQNEVKAPVCDAVGGGVERPQLLDRASTFRVVSRNAAANLIRQGCAWIVILVLPPLLVRYLTKESYATWVLILQIGGYVTLIDGAIQSAVGRFVAHAKSLNDRQTMSQMVSSALLLLLLASAIACVLLAAIAWMLPLLLQHSSAELNHTARRILWIVGLAYVVTLPFGAVAGIFVGLQQNGINAVATTIGKVVSAAGVAWAAVHHLGLIWMASLTAVGVLIQPVFYLLALRRVPDSPQFSLRSLNRASVRIFFSFSAAILLTQFTSLLISGLDMPIVTAFDFKHAAYYAIAATLSNMLLIPFSAVISPLMPVAASVHANSTPDHLGRLLIRMTRMAACLLCLLTLLLLVGMQPLLRLWINADYARHTSSFAEVLILAQFVRLSLLPYALVGFSAGQQKRMLASPIVEGLVNLICSLVGAAYFGAIGVAIGTLVGAIAGVALHFLVSMRKTSAIRFQRSALLREILWPALLTAVCLGMYLLVDHYLHTTTASIAMASLCECIAALLLLRFVLSSVDRMEFGNHLRTFRNRLPHSP